MRSWKRQQKQATLNAIDVYVAPYVRYLSETFLPGKAFNLMTAMFRKMRLALRVFREGKYDLVFVRYEDTFDGLVGTYIKTKYKIPLVYELDSPLMKSGKDIKSKPRGPYSCGTLWPRLRLYSKYTL